MRAILFFLTVTFPLLAQLNMLVFAGSTRADSYNKQLASLAADVGREMGANVTLIDLKDYPMPFYDADLEKKGMPKQVKKFRDLMMQNDAIVIASPEYNGSVSAVLKNAIDWASRSEEGAPSTDAFKGKKFALMSASPGRGGGARGLVHLKMIIENVGGTVLPDEISVPNAHTAFDKKHLPELKKDIQSELKPLFK